MTLTPYTPEMIDQLALRLLDMAASVRGMGTRIRETGLEHLPIHDRKVLQWCECLEQWCHRARASLEVEIQAVKAARRARRMRLPADQA